MPGTAARSHKRGRLRKGEWRDGTRARRVILKRDRYASLSRALFLFSRALSTIASSPPPPPGHFLLFPHSPPRSLIYLAVRFTPLDLPVRLSATPSLHSGRIVSERLCESVLEESLRIRMRKGSTCGHACLCVAQITRHISSLESRRNPFRLPPSDLTRRPRAEGVLLFLRSAPSR